MAKLSVNINKVATLRNARGGAIPDVVQVAKDCQVFGAEGITVHPRSDERHITYQDVYDLKEVINTEFNIEGFPDERWLKLLEEVKPEQATLVPDNPTQLTSDHGWDTITKAEELKEIVSRLQLAGCRVSLFIDPVSKMIEGAKKVGADRVELYTGPYAWEYDQGKEAAISDYIEASKTANEFGLGINAGHDLSLNNLEYLIQQIPAIDEVSIGHALIADALYLGLEESISQYLKQAHSTASETV